MSWVSVSLRVVRKKLSIVARSLMTPAPGVRLTPAGTRVPAKLGLVCPVTGLRATPVENGLK